MIRNLLSNLRIQLLIMVTVIIGILSLILYITINQGIDLILSLISITIIILLTGLGISWELFVIKRINSILKATKNLISGNSLARAGLPYGNSELGELAKYFDQLADILEAREKERQQTENEIKRHNRDLAVLNNITAAVSSTLELPEIIGQLKQLLAGQLSIPGGIIFACDRNKSDISLSASWGLTPDFLDDFQTFEEVKNQHDLAIEKKEVVVIPDLNNGMQMTYQRLGGIRQKWLSYLCVPLIAKDEIEAIADLFIQEPTAFFQDRVALLKTIGQQVGVIIQNAKLYEQVKTCREQLRTLSQQILDIQEAERRHISRELHDEVGQALTAIKVNLQLLEREAGVVSSFLEIRDENINLLDRTLQQVRNLSLDLRPSLLDDLGMVAAIRWYVDRQAQRAGFTAHITADPPDMRFNSSLETTCFRVVQEALTNVVRHAQAKDVYIGLSLADNTLNLIIEDNGIGFDLQAVRERGANDTSLGLLGMQERVRLLGGQIKIESTAEHGQGTKIASSFPVKSEETQI